MNTIVLYPANALQLTFLQELVEKLRVKFSSITKKQDDSLFTKEAYFAMLDERIKSAEQGNTIPYTPELEMELFGSVL